MRIYTNEIYFAFVRLFGGLVGIAIHDSLNHIKVIYYSNPIHKGIKIYKASGLTEKKYKEMSSKRSFEDIINYFEKNKEIIFTDGDWE